MMFIKGKLPLYVFSEFHMQIYNFNITLYSKNVITIKIKLTMIIYVIIILQVENIF